MSPITPENRYNFRKSNFFRYSNPYIVIEMQFLKKYFTIFILSCFVSVEAGYFYPHPQPPIYQDIPVQPPQFLPPNSPPVLDQVPDITYLPTNPIQPPPERPPLDVQPPLFDTPGITETDDSVIIELPPIPPLPPQYLPPSNQYLPPATRQSDHAQTRFVRISNLSCVDSTDETSKFHAQFSSIQPFNMSPSMEDSSYPNCIDVVSENIFKVHLEGPLVKKCGVKRCVNSNTKERKMCLHLRMATVKGIKLPEDFQIMVQCSPQPSVMAHTKELRFRSQISNEQRTLKNVAVASGGAQRKLDVGLDLLRKSANSDTFNEIVIAETPVYLGEELLLRATVKNGNGFTNTRMDSVVMRSTSTKESSTLVDENGCTNPFMRNICPDLPQQISPLVVVFPFRAFLFQGSDRSDEMVLSMRMIGCLNSKDCLQINHCNDDKIGNRRRIVRSTDPTDEITDEELRFRVLPFEKSPNSTIFELMNEKIQLNSQETFFFAFFTLFSIIFLCIVITCLSCYKFK
ncbi:uncharacterized protein LOC123677447 [Harmonia axyridis]|uniref:uncharacterized protein LOC123677447 n=1 Tax=Harmonia axyridis TaxID=115357 RepID=UPI001E276820|nr:uncharacterized protein LOC123677447 [Harmonia axyridis]